MDNVNESVLCLESLNQNSLKECEIIKNINNKNSGMVKASSSDFDFDDKLSKQKDIHNNVLTEDFDRNNMNLISEKESILQRKTLTVVHQHPLMFPPPNKTDSDSIRNIQNYPDVVPEIECTNDLSKNTISDSCFKFRGEKNKSNVNEIDLLPDTNFQDVNEFQDFDNYQNQTTVIPAFESVMYVSNQSNKSESIPRKLRYYNKSRETISKNSDVSTLSDNSEDESDKDFSISSSRFNMDEISSDRDHVVPEIKTEPLPLYTALEERRDSRNWQKITLPDGKFREIDMKVIEPYKRVLSHGGYLKACGHNAIIVFSACHLPDKSRTDYHYVMDNLFLYVVKTLDELVTDDYILIYLQGGSNHNSVPSFQWLKKCYQLIDRRLRKSLRNLFFVHPTFWIKSFVWMSRPFVSSKFWRKIIYCRTLEELYNLVPVERAAVPEKVKMYNKKLGYK